MRAVRWAASMVVVGVLGAGAWQVAALHSQVDGLHGQVASLQVQLRATAKQASSDATKAGTAAVGYSAQQWNALNQSVTALRNADDVQAQVVGCLRAALDQVVQTGSTPVTC